jgi:hypothetical protein
MRLHPLQGKAASALDDGEAVGNALSILLGALEPPLVTDLHVADVQLAALGSDGGSDQVVAAALVSVS